MKRTAKIILASQSPRRKELLKQVGLSFTVSPADISEQPFVQEKPEHYARRIALDKALMVSQREKHGIIISADTIVVLHNAILGKPQSRTEAAKMLAALSNRKHRVITGIVVLDAETGRRTIRSAVTYVWFKRLSFREISSYIATGEPLDKAGAYGIQGRGALFVKKLDGCYFNVVGLPLSLLASTLASFGIELF